MGSRDYFRHTALIGSLTLVSRLLGVARDVVCAGYFGAGAVWDAFSFAFRVPNLFRRLMGEGALSAAFIPIFTEHLELRDRAAAWRLAWTVATAVAGVLVACLLLGESLLLALQRFCQLGERWRLTLILTAVMLPYMVFICLTALAGAILNSLKHFTAPALSPVVLNICWIIAVIIIGPAVTGDPATRAVVLAGGIVGAGVLQLGLQLAALARKGFCWRPTFEAGGIGLRRVLLAMAPVAAGMAAFQVNVLLDGVIAISLAAEQQGQSFRLLGAQLGYPMLVGANSVLYYASRLMQFPLGVFGIALATAFFPTLSQRAARKEWDGFSEALSDALGAVVFIALPAGAGLIVLGRPAVELLFERGAFTQAMSTRTTVALAAYSTGLWAYCAHHVLMRAFYSTQDSATPAKVAGGAVALNLALNLALVWPLREAGLAAATAVSSAAQAVILYLILHRRIGLRSQRRLVATLVRSLLCTAFMVGICLAALRALPPSPPGDLLAVKALRVAVPLLAGGLAYFGAAAAVGVAEMDLLLDALRRRLRGGRPA